MGLNISVPDFKMPKIKLSKNINIDKIEEIVKNFQREKKDKRNKNGLYDITRYDTIKDMFVDVTEKYKDNVCILDKFEKKGEYIEISYSKFKHDVEAFGTRNNRIFRSKK